MDQNSMYLPMISVIVPAYNEEKRIALCIQALLAQDYPEDRREIIIVDNNSKDATREIIRNLPVRLMVEQEIQGPAATRNRGILAAQGDLIVFTDADCLPRPDWLKNISKVFTSPEIVGAVGTMHGIGKKGLYSEFMEEVNTIKSHEGSKFWYVVTANVAFRRDVVLKLGLFSTNLYTGEDIDLGLRVQIEGGKIVGAPDAIVDHFFDNSWEEITERFRRYGYSEILLDSIYQRTPGYLRPTGYQYRQVIRQVGALFVYLGAFGLRVFRSIFRGWNKKYIIWPLLWFMAEFNNLIGKVRGLIETRFLTHVPTKRLVIKKS